MYKLDNELGQQDFFQPRTIQHVQRQEIMHFLSDVIGDKTRLARSFLLAKLFVLQAASLLEQV